MLKAASILSILFISKCRCSSNPRPGRSGPAPATRALAVLSSARPGSREIRRGMFGPVPARPSAGYRHRAAAGRGSSRPVADSESRGVGASGSGTGPGAQRSPTLRGGRRPDLFSSSSAARCSPRRAACLAALLASPRCSALLASRHGLAVVRQQRHRRLVQLLGLLPRAAADIRVRACVRACARATALCHAVAHDAALMAPRRPEVVWAPLA